MDKGTLYQLRNLINRRNVVSSPQENLAACEEFYLLVVEGHILSAVFTVFKMNGFDDTPSVDFFPESFATASPSEQKSTFVRACTEVVNRYVDMTFGKGTSPDTNTSDGIRGYACDVLSLGLFYKEYLDAIHEGDGDRLIRCWRYLLLIFKSTGRTNYSIEAFTLLSQYSLLFTPRMAAQLKWNRTINIHGIQGKNVPSDLHMEHLNKHCKTAIAGMGANITDEAVLRVGKAIGPLFHMMNSFDKNNKVSSESGKHSTRGTKKDLEEIVKELFINSKVFTDTAGREHKFFPKFRPNIMSGIDMIKLKQWMNTRFQKLITYQ